MATQASRLFLALMARQLLAPHGQRSLLLLRFIRSSQRNSHPQTHPALVAGLALAGGAAAYGARVLNVLTTRKYVDARACGKADAVTNALGECGGAVAGLPLISLVQARGWAAYTRAVACAALALVAAHAALAAEAARATTAAPPRGGGARDA